MKRTLLRSLFSLAVHASARFPRLVPMAVVEFVDRRFYDAAMRETLRHDHFMHAYEWRRATEEHCEEQRRSFAFGQVAMHNPSVTREQVDAIADTMPAPCAGWDALCGDGPELAEEVGEEHAAMVDLHDASPWPSSRGGKEWIA